MTIICFRPQVAQARNQPRPHMAYKTAINRPMGPHRRDVTHFLSKISCFSLKLFKFSLVTETIGFFRTNSCFKCYATDADSISSLGYLCSNQSRSSLTLVLQTGNIDMVLGMNVKASKNCIRAGGFLAARPNSLNINQYQ